MSIPKHLHSDLAAKAGAGLTCVEIADWLLAEHGVQVTSRGVSAHLAARADERAEITRSLAREKLGLHVTSDLDALDEARGRARALEEKATAEGKLTVALRAIETQVKIIDTKLRYSGAGTGEAPTADARAALVAKLAEALGS